MGAVMSEKPTVPLWKGQPITPGWWWLQFSDAPGPRYWDGTFWKRGSYFAGAEDYAAFPILGACPLPTPEVPPTPEPTRAMFAAEQWVELEYNSQVQNGLVQRCVGLLTEHVTDPGDVMVCLGAIIAGAVHKSFDTTIDRRAAVKAITECSSELLAHIEKRGPTNPQNTGDTDAT